MRKHIILIIEDEAAIRDLLRFTITDPDYQLMEAENSKEAEYHLAETIPDLILLDWMLPGKSGIEFLKWLRQQELYQNIPVMMLTAKAEEENKVTGLNVGADDYVTKPFSPAELRARIKSILRRGPLIQPNNILKVDGIEVNTESHTVACQHQMISLTPIEYKLLYFLMSHVNKVYDREQLIHHVWSGAADINDRTIDVSIRRLRDKLKPFNKHQLIKTIRGAGYLFESSLA